LTIDNLNRKPLLLNREHSTEVGLPLEPPPSVRQGHGRVHVGRSLPLAGARQEVNVHGSGIWVKALMVQEFGSRLRAHSPGVFRKGLGLRNEHLRIKGKYIRFTV